MLFSVPVAIPEFGNGTGPILLDGVECRGDEDNLFQCPHGGIMIHNCDHSEDAAVRCLSGKSDRCTQPAVQCGN